MSEKEPKKIISGSEIAKIWAINRLIERDNWKIFRQNIIEGEFDLEAQRKPLEEKIDVPDNHFSEFVEIQDDPVFPNLDNRFEGKIPDLETQHEVIAKPSRN